MNVLADFAKNKSRLRWIYITFLQYIWRRKRLYIYFVFFEIFYIGFAFVHCAGWGSFAWFSGGAIRPRVCGDGAFTGDFLAGELCEIFVFFAVVVTNFCIFIMLVICLFIYLLLLLLLLLLLFWLASFKHIRFCWFELF